MTYTKDQLIIFDKILNYYYDFDILKTERKTPTDDLFAKLFDIDTELAQFCINEVLKNGHDLEILNSQKHGYGSYSLVTLHKTPTELFINQGGFSKYFEEKKKQSFDNKIHVGDIISNVEQLNKNEIHSSSDFLVKPTYIKNKPDNISTILTIIGLVLTLISVYIAYLQLN